MKNMIVILCSLFALQVMAQTQTLFIEPYRLDIASAKTTNLIFPFAVQSVDRGSRDLLVQKARGTENILHVKAGRNDFEPTNLTVITADGKLYSFLVSFAQSPAHFNIIFQEIDSARVRFSDQKNADALQKNAKKVLLQKSMFHHIKAIHGGMQLQLAGLYVAEDIFYFQFALRNGSNINFDSGGMRFSVRDRQESKRRASQENELEPVCRYPDSGSIREKSQREFVVALAKFPWQDHQVLCIHLSEKNGSRDLQLRIPNKRILAAKHIL